MIDISDSPSQTYSEVGSNPNTTSSSDNEYQRVSLNHAKSAEDLRRIRKGETDDKIRIIKTRAAATISIICFIVIAIAAVFFNIPVKRYWFLIFVFIVSLFFCFGKEDVTRATKLFKKIAHLIFK